MELYNLNITSYFKTWIEIEVDNLRMTVLEAGYVDLVAACGLEYVGIGRRFLA